MKRIVALTVMLLAPAVCGCAVSCASRSFRRRRSRRRSGAEALGPFERITGKIHGELDPNDPKNAIITDIKLAPRNASGKVEYIATFTLVKPVDMTKASGVSDVLGRQSRRRAGRARARMGTSRLSAAGRVTSCRPPTIRRSGAASRGTRTARSITGPLVVRFTNRFVDQAGSTIPLMIPREQPAVSAGDARHETGDADCDHVGKCDRCKTRVDDCPEHRLGVRRLRNDGVPRHAGSDALA